MGALRAPRRLVRLFIARVTELKLMQYSVSATFTAAASADWNIKESMVRVSNELDQKAMRVQHRVPMYSPADAANK